MKRFGWITLVAGLAGLMVLVTGCSGSREIESAGEPGGPTTTIEADDQVTDSGEPADQGPAGEAVEDPDGDVDEGQSTSGSGDGPGTTTTVDPGPPSTTTPEPDDPLTPVAPGDRSDDVVALQERLAEVGISPGSADGSYGRRTEAAVSVFQELTGLPSTGTADAVTMRELAAFSYDGLLLAAGDEGPEVEELQQRLASGPFDPGPIDGQYGTATVAAVWALEKLAGVPVDGDWGPADELAWQRLADGEVGRPTEDHDQRWVEVDLSTQLATVYDPGVAGPVLITHVSSGSGVPWSNEEHSGSSITPLGDFHITRRISGWRESSLDIGRLYNPLYFNGGIAFHGATSVPNYPASHGCIRVPMHIAEYLPDELPDGTPVHVMA